MVTSHNKGGSVFHFYTDVSNAREYSKLACLSLPTPITLLLHLRSALWSLVRVEGQNTLAYYNAM